MIWVLFSFEVFDQYRDLFECLPSQVVLAQNPSKKKSGL